MANVTETQTWENGVYQLETTDPILGGANGTANVQAKQLANRTAYLKARADQVDAAKAGYASLDDRLDQMDLQAQALGVDMQDMSGATLKFALDMAGLANSSVDALKSQFNQSGTVSFVNRGVINGCTISRNPNVARNLDLIGGRAFANGQTYRVYTKEGAASVPINDTDSAVTVKAYLVDAGSGQMTLGVTSLTGSLPDGSIHIYNLVIPAYHIGADISAVTLTSVRRIESNYPVLFDSAPSIYIALPKNLKDAGYQVAFDLISASGGNPSSDSFKVHSRASNGFGITPHTLADTVTLGWRIQYLNH
ncbi:hypothetical protein [Thiomicrorhabdus sp.]|uniref:hypothetical protein n=1 Tax=Thiomicrorhabdus sp. TaxID=2039724 RepID=UPI0029C912DF|nr:hypothetical protein [Thiomicrorhabdus sp.]